METKRPLKYETKQLKKPILKGGGSTTQNIIDGL